MACLPCSGAQTRGGLCSSACPGRPPLSPRPARWPCSSLDLPSALSSAAPRTCASSSRNVFITMLVFWLGRSFLFFKTQHRHITSGNCPPAPPTAQPHCTVRGRVCVPSYSPGSGVCHTHLCAPGPSIMPSTHGPLHEWLSGWWGARVHVCVGHPWGAELCRQRAWGEREHARSPALCQETAHLTLAATCQSQIGAWELPSAPNHGEYWPLHGPASSPGVARHEPLRTSQALLGP